MEARGSSTVLGAQGFPEAADVQAPAHPPVFPKFAFPGCGPQAKWDGPDSETERLAKAWIIIKVALPVGMLFAADLLPLRVPLSLCQSAPGMVASLAFGMVCSLFATLYVFHPIAGMLIRALPGNLLHDCKGSAELIAHTLATSIGAFVWVELVPVLLPDASDATMMANLQTSIQTLWPNAASNLEASFRPEASASSKGIDVASVICVKSITYLLPAAYGLSSLLLFHDKLRLMHGWHVTMFLSVPVALATCLDWISNPFIMHRVPLTSIVSILCTGEGTMALFGFVCHHLSLQHLLEVCTSCDHVTSAQQEGHRRTRQQLSGAPLRTVDVKMAGEFSIYGFDVIVGRAVGLYLMHVHPPALSKPASSGSSYDWAIVISVLSLSIWFAVIVTFNILNLVALALNCRERKISVDIRNISFSKKTITLHVKNAGSWPFVLNRGMCASFSLRLGGTLLLDGISITLTRKVIVPAAASAELNGIVHWQGNSELGARRLLASLGEFLCKSSSPQIEGYVSVPFLLTWQGSVSISVPEFTCSCPEWVHGLLDHFIGPSWRQKVQSSSQLLGSLGPESTMQQFLSSWLASGLNAPFLTSAFRSWQQQPSDKGVDVTAGSHQSTEDSAGTKLPTRASAPSASSVQVEQAGTAPRLDDIPTCRLSRLALPQA